MVFKIDTNWVNGTNYATFSLYLSNTGSAETNVPYEVTLSNPDYTGITNYWNWQARVDASIHSHLLRHIHDKCREDAMIGLA